MNDFTASNGVTLGHSPEGHILLPKSVMGLGEDTQQALREFFQAEADERLGRWRWPENPDYVVHLDDGYAVVVSESDPSRRPDRVHRRYLEDPEGSLGWGEFAARAYFDAHPEPKPWHDAKTGEAWVLTFDADGGGGTSAWVVDQEGQFGSPEYTNTVSRHDPHIIAGRPVWQPEVSS